MRQKSAWSRFVERLPSLPRPPRRAIPTIPGLFALGAPTFLGMAAVTATNNLLFLLLGATLGSIVLSGILSERNIRPIRVRVRPVGPAYREEPARLEVRFDRPEAKHVAYDLRFREAPGSVLPFFRRILSPPEAVDVHIPVMEGRTSTVIAERVFRERGRASLPISEVSTRYPFGLLVKAKDVEADVEVIVRPRRVNRPPDLARPPGVSGLGESQEQRGTGVDVYGLRERRSWDPLHRVHALRSMALGRDVVLEMTGLHRPVAQIGVATDLRADPQALERALELAQAALTAWADEGFAVGLTTFSGSYAPGEAEIADLLDHLAIVDASHPSWPRKGGPETWLVPVGARPPTSAATILVGQDGLREEGRQAA